VSPVRSKSMGLWGNKQEIAKLIEQINKNDQNEQKITAKRQPRTKQPKIGAKVTGYLLTPDGAPMRCASPGCQKRLKTNPKSICCSEECAAALLEWCNAVITALTAQNNPENYPVWARTKQPKRQKRCKILEKLAKNDETGRQDQTSDGNAGDRAMRGVQRAPKTPE
jgi:hypothetical protein